MRTTSLACSFAIACAALAPDEALACGGCFVPPPASPDKSTVVTAHRMALSISAEQTILWDQIRYAGAPDEFAWVLPVKKGARVEIATDAWFDVLDAATSSLVFAPDLECPGFGGLGCSTAPPPAAAMGCGNGAAEGPGLTEEGEPVTVVSHGSAGPYETVILSSDEPGALQAWLTDHDYAIPEDIYPLIDAYVAEGFDFVALRLLPAQGIQQMRPVRVVQPGAVTTLPLRMVAAGTGPRTEITLFVLGEGRYTPQNFAEVTIPDMLMRFHWDFLTQSSNFAEIRSKILDLGDKSSFWVPFAEKGALFGPIENRVTGLNQVFATTDGFTYPTIARTFVEQAFVNGETSSTDCGALFPALVEDTRRVVKACAPDGTCRAVDAANEIDARTLMCDAPLGSDIPLDDLAEALVGMHPADVWLTRMEANLPRAALAKDLVLEPAAEQIEKSHVYQAVTGNDPPAPCKVAGDESSVAPPPPRRVGPSAPETFALALATVAALAMLRRVRMASRAGQVRT
jgi:hypothetical protein